MTAAELRGRRQDTLLSVPAVPWPAEWDWVTKWSGGGQGRGQGDRTPQPAPQASPGHKSDRAGHRCVVTRRPGGGRRLGAGHSQDAEAWGLPSGGLDVPSFSRGVV